MMDAVIVIRRRRRSNRYSNNKQKAMLYHLFEWFKEQGYKFPGSALFEFITFRVLMAMLLALVISMLFGRRIIWTLRKRLIGEAVRDLGLVGEQSKKGTPTMGGIIIILAI